jgi:hypothetical protein
MRRNVNFEERGKKLKENKQMNKRRRGKENGWGVSKEKKGI